MVSARSDAHRHEDPGNRPTAAPGSNEGRTMSAHKRRQGCRDSAASCEDKRSDSPPSGRGFCLTSLLMGEADGKFAGFFPARTPSSWPLTRLPAVSTCSRLARAPPPLVRLSSWQDPKDVASFASRLPRLPPVALCPGRGARRPSSGLERRQLFRIETLAADSRKRS